MVRVLRTGLLETGNDSRDPRRKRLFFRLGLPALHFRLLRVLFGSARPMLDSGAIPNQRFGAK
jgi:hypothetical protein